MIDRIRWTGDNYVDLCVFTGRELLRNGDNIILVDKDLEEIEIPIGDFIIKNSQGGFYGSCA